MRWVYSIECELKRVRNDKKIKVIKERNVNCNIIIDYEEADGLRDFFSYSNKTN